jgi:HD-like signal output (HDOD) protein
MGHLAPDVGMEEIRIAALLHDLAKFWLRHRSRLAIQARQAAKPGLRSAEAQTQVLGFSFQEIQMALCRTWHLPELLQHLISDEHSEQAQVRNVSLAVRLARHSAHGWNDPALPDDYKDIGQLLNITPEAVRQRIGLDPMPAREADGSEAG